MYTCPSTLWDIVYGECVERLIKHKAKPSALSGLETHSEYTVSHKVRSSIRESVDSLCRDGVLVDAIPTFSYWLSEV